jgi:hypothetical protein
MTRIRRVFGVGILITLALGTIRLTPGSAAIGEKVAFAAYTDSDNGRNLLDFAVFDSGRLIYDVGDQGGHTYRETRYRRTDVAKMKREFSATLAVPEASTAATVQRSSDCPTDIGIWFFTVDGRKGAFFDPCDNRFGAFVDLRSRILRGAFSENGVPAPVRAKFVRYTVRVEEAGDFDPTFDASKLPRWSGDPLPTSPACVVSAGGRRTRAVEYADNVFRVGKEFKFVQLIPTVETRIDGKGICAFRPTDD